MKPTWGKPRWCYSCNQWQVIIIVVLFLCLSTYGIFKLTQDPYRTIMGELCDLPRDYRIPDVRVWYSQWGAGTTDSISVAFPGSSISIYELKPAIPDSAVIDSAYIIWEMKVDYPAPDLKKPMKEIIKRWEKP